MSSSAGSLVGRVALVTGAARGQGRSHAVRLAQEGCDVIALDLCDQMPTIPYPMSRPEDLAETVRQVEAADRRIVAIQVDVRDHSAMKAAVDRGVAELGRLDIVAANAGVSPMGFAGDDPVRAWQDTIEVNLSGVWNTIMVSAPHIIAGRRGGSIVVTGSSAGLKSISAVASPGSAAYTASKHGVVGLTRIFARDLAKHSIRVNSIHPSSVNTPMIDNEIMRTWLADNNNAGAVIANALPIGAMEPAEISNAVVWLAGDQARFVTGVALPVDAGFMLS